MLILSYFSISSQHSDSGLRSPGKVLVTLSNMCMQTLGAIIGAVIACNIMGKLAFKPSREPDSRADSWDSYGASRPCE